MSFPRRRPSKIALQLLECIDEKDGKALKWDLIKILGNESQFQQWVTNFLLKDKFIKEIQDSNRTFYCKTESGKFFHKLLKNGKIVKRVIACKWKTFAAQFLI